MNISEADSVCMVLNALTINRHVDADELRQAIAFLDRRAARSLQVGSIVPADTIPAAAARLTQRGSAS